MKESNNLNYELVNDQSGDKKPEKVFGVDENNLPAYLSFFNNQSRPTNSQIYYYLLSQAGGN